MQRRDQVLLGDSALGKELLHQLVFSLGHQLDQRLMSGACGREHMPCGTSPILP